MFVLEEQKVPRVFDEPSTGRCDGSSVLYSYKLRNEAADEELMCLIHETLVYNLFIL